LDRKSRVLKKLRKEIRSGIYSYLVLKIIETGELHGYAIRKFFENLTSGEFVPSEGALYDLLKSLQKQGLVESFWVMDGRPRKCYRLTELGKEVLEEIKAEINLIGEIIRKLEEVEEWTE
jgi:DNA-binding PadR family transcriptional regulator